MTKTFLRAEWRKLIMINYSVDEAILKPYLPRKTEIDLWKDTCYISLVGFMFLNTAVKGIKIPFHTNFEEVNLRFYVRYKDGAEWKRGVVFIKEIVPLPTLSYVANVVYKEHYETLPMRHRWNINNESLLIEYRWKKEKWNSILVDADILPKKIDEGSEEEFITEHYWGYTKLSETKTSEYKVEHPKWDIYHIQNHSVEVDFADIYGSDFDFLLNQIPRSVFLAEGSEIKVKEGRVI